MRHLKVYCRIMPTPNRILIVDDHALVRDGIQHILGGIFPEVRFEQCEEGDGAISKVASEHFDLVVLDISLPKRHGIEVLHALKELRPLLPVVVLSVFREEAYAVRALQLGAAAYLEKGGKIEALLQAVQVALAGGRYLTPAQEKMLAVRENQKFIPKGAELLSPKEHAIFLRLAAGEALKLIAADLHLSPKTVTTYRSRILEKLALDSNAAIAKYAVQHGLIE